MNPKEKKNMQKKKKKALTALSLKILRTHLTP